MHMLRCLFFFQAHYSFSYTARHIPGIDNTLADALSCNNATLFLSKVPNADKIPTHIPQELMELLVIQKPDWTSQSWTTLFQYYFEQGLSTSTHKTYKTGIKKFDEFCKKHKIINPLPVDQRLLCYYISGPARFGRLNHQGVPISSQTSSHCL